MRKAERSDRAAATVTVAAIVVYLLFIAYQSLGGTTIGLCVTPLVQQGAHLSRSDGIANLVAYVPLGILVASRLASSRPQRRIRIAALLAGFVSIAAFSLTMELLQACLPGRVSSWYDWATNSSGGLIGLLALPLGRRLQAAAGRHRLLASAAASPVFVPALLCLGAWLALCTAPWQFTLDVGTIRGNLSFLRQLAQWSGPDPWRLASHLCGWLTIGVALRSVWPDRAAAVRALLMLAGAALIAQLLLVVPALSVEELIGMGLAIVANALLQRLATKGWLARALPVIALLAVAVYELKPYPGGAYSSGFEWWPQIGRGGLLGALELALLFCWLAFALVLSLRWSENLGRVIGRRRFVLPMMVAFALLLMEFAQHWIPGRVPDTSAPVFTLLAYTVAWALTGPALALPAALMQTAKEQEQKTRQRSRSDETAPERMVREQ